MTEVALEIIIGIVLTLAVSWVAFVVALMVFRPRGIDLAEARRLVPDLVRLLRDLGRDPSLPSGVRRRIGFLLAYLAMPFDLVPDFIPVLGYADDVIVVALVLRGVIRHAGPQALEAHWNGTEQGLALVRRLAGLEVPPTTTLPR